MPKRILLAGAALVLAAFAHANPPGDDGPAYGSANAWANLPTGVRYPEGITANPANGDIFVGTFDFGPNPNKLVRIGRNGNVEAQKDFGGAPLLGLGFANGKVYIGTRGDNKGGATGSTSRDGELDVYGLKPN